MQSSQAENINNSFFDSHYKEIWRELIPEELTIREIDFMLQQFNLRLGNKVLDIMCGYGRHAIGLAKKGIHVTAVDNLSDYISEIKKAAKEENLPITCIETDVINFAATDIYDLAICMGNSLNFFNEENTIKLIKTISKSMKSGGRFLIHTWSLAEIVTKNFKEKSWSYVGDFKFLTDSKYLFNPSRIEADYFFIASDGTTEKKNGIDYIFSINEIQAMLKKFDFEIKDIYSIPGKKKFTVGEPRAYIVAEKE
jgi:SAM-dependent methyltransferase